MTGIEHLYRLVIAYREVGLGNPTYPLTRGWRLANALAIPRTGRRGNCHYFRHPRGKRQALIEGARAIPPSSWDDIQISTRYGRNWKRHRKTQWHESV